MTIIYFILAALVLGVLVLIHELGHLLAAKAVGMDVEAFSIGFGPALFKKVVGGMEYRVGTIPFGGYVRIKGMERKGKDAQGQAVSVYDIPRGFFFPSTLEKNYSSYCGSISEYLISSSGFWSIISFRRKK